MSISRYFFAISLVILLPLAISLVQAKNKPTSDSELLTEEKFVDLIASRLRATFPDKTVKTHKKDKFVRLIGILTALNSKFQPNRYVNNEICIITMNALHAHPIFSTTVLSIFYDYIRVFTI